MNERLKEILTLLESSGGIFDISLSPDQCIILLDYINYLKVLEVNKNVDISTNESIRNTI